MVKDCKYIELFAGVGGFHVGLDRVNPDFFKCVMANQWEPGKKDQFAADIYKKRFPNDLLINDDVTTINGSDYNVDLVMGGFPCLSGDTLVLTSDGYKFITDVKEGDMVLSHDNKYHRVNKFMNQGVKNTFKIVGTGFDKIEATGNHRFFVRERVYTKLGKKFLNAEWKSIDDIKSCYKNYYLGSSVNQNSIVPDWKGVYISKNQHTGITKCNLDMNDGNLWYIIGRFLGDGWLRKQQKEGDNRCSYNGIIICCGKDEYGELSNKISDKYHYTVVEEETTYKFIFSDVELAYFCEQFYSSGEHIAVTKRLPGFVFDLPVDLLEQLLKGYQDSDGCTTGIYNQFTSVSRELLFGIAHCIEKVYHKPTMVGKCNVSEKRNIEGRIVNQRPFYQLKYRNSEPKHKTYFYEDGYIWYPISKITDGITQNVYDIEVDDSHSFVANHCITHNCQDYSVARTKSSSTGIVGKKGVLWWQVIRILGEMNSKPKFLLFENVDRMLISPSKQRGRDFALILQSLVDLGYNVEWRVINAAEYGMPQKRKRVFIFAFLKGVFAVKNPGEWLHKDGLLAKAFPIQESDYISLWNSGFMIKGDNEDLADVSNDFNRSNSHSHPFENGGVVIDGVVYTETVKSDYKEGTYITLGDILVTGDDRNQITDDYYISDEDAKKWEYVKGKKSFERTNKDGYTYTYNEGGMAFPDYLDRPARTIITSEISSTPNRFTHIVKDPVDGRLRRLIPLELERIQMFPDNHTQGTTDKKRGFLMGNALVCGIVERIGTELYRRLFDTQKNEQTLYREAESEAWKYVEENDSYTNIEFFMWAKRKAEAKQKGIEFDEPEPKFDHRKVQFDGLDMFNAFMSGYRYYKKIHDTHD